QAGEGVLLADVSVGSWPRIRANSAVLTPGCWSGRSRNHHQKTTHQITPRMPKIQKACRQRTTGCPCGVTVWIIKASTAKDAMPPAKRPAIQTVPWAKPRSPNGNQL